MTVGDGQPFEFPKAVGQSEGITRYATVFAEQKKGVYLSRYRSTGCTRRRRPS